MTTADRAPDGRGEAPVPERPTPLPVDRQVAPADPSASGDPAESRPERRGRLLWVVVGSAIVVAIVVVLAPLASPDPDGLESVAGQQGWLDAGRSSLGLLAGYEIPGLGGSTGTVVAGLLGVGVVLLAVLGLGRLLRRRDASRR